jgi:hypothetical protein
MVRESAAAPRERAPTSRFPSARTYSFKQLAFTSWFVYNPKNPPKTLITFWYMGTSHQVEFQKASTARPDML